MKYEETLRGPPCCVMQLAGTIVNYVYNIPNCTIILVLYIAYCDFYNCGPRTLCKEKLDYPAFRCICDHLEDSYVDGRYQVDIKWSM
jgi:hypothetical protein